MMRTNREQCKNKARAFCEKSTDKERTKKGLLDGIYVVKSLLFERGTTFWKQPISAEGAGDW